MTKNKREDDSLREAAEKIIKSGKAKVTPPEATDVQSLLHELSVHQVEFETQNENLRQAKMQAEEARQHYSLLFHDARVAYFVLDGNGVIKEVNREGQGLIGLPANRLVGMHVRTYLSGDSALAFHSHLQASLAGDGKQRCEVTCRTNSREALAAFRLDPSRFDLVITDVTMPDMTGVVLAKEIRALRPGMPIILCTGFSHLVDAKGAREAGIKAFVMKPLTKKEIARTVRRVLDE